MEERAMAIRVSCHGITWGRNGLEQCVKDLQTLGFRGFEAFAFVAEDYALARLREFQDLLKQHGLELVALYGGGNMHDSDLFDDVVEDNERLAKFLQANGARRLVLGPGSRPRGGPSREHLQTMVRCANEIRRRAPGY